ncbi:hypothetical protein Tco_0260431, partial [Tanacetum coccineum]
MANLRYSEKHNMVAFFKKPTESVGFTEIADFLKGSSLRTLANGIQELVASINVKEYIITEASVRSKLQLADATRITNLLNAEIYVGLATLGPKSGGWDQFGSPIATALICLSSNRVQHQIKVRDQQSQLDPNPLDPVPSTSQPPIPSTTEPPHSSPLRYTEGATTTTTSLDEGLDSGNINESPLRSHDIPLHDVNTSGSMEDSLKLTELSLLVPKLELKIGSLDKELKETKQTFGNVILTLVDRVKSLEVALKRKSKKIQEEDISPTTLKAAKTLSKVASLKARSTNKGRRYKRRKMSKGKDINTSLDAKVEVNTSSIEINTGREKINTGNAPVVVQTVNIIIPSPVKGQREGKAPMTTEDVQVTKRTKAQIQQEEDDLAEAIRLQALQDEEAARQVHLDALLAKRIQEEQELYEQQQKRKAKVQEAAQYYTEEDWDTIRAKLEANAKLIKSHQGESMTGDDFPKRIVEMINQKKKYYAEHKAKAKRSKPKTQAQQRNYMSTFIKNQITWKLAQLKKLTFEELKTEFEKLVKSIESIVPIRSEERVKRHGIQLKQETLKKQKIVVEDVPEEKAEENMEAIEKGDPSLGKKGVYQIVREDGTDKIYISFGAMLKDISTDDLTELYRLVMQRYGTNGSKDKYERVFWGDLKIMFDPPLTDIYMLTERRYPLPADVCQAMLDKKLQGDKRDEACYQFYDGVEKDCLSVGFATTQQMVINIIIQLGKYGDEVVVVCGCDASAEDGGAPAGGVGWSGEDSGDGGCGGGGSGVM